ncbi:MAG: iron complex transport system permease protein [Chloroflexi bacterium]|nr:MAG: iron complex transport system permease protein [Chloroflexota bacterium]
MTTQLPLPRQLPRLAGRRLFAAPGLRSVVLLYGTGALLLVLAIAGATAVGSASISFGDTLRILIDSLPLIEVDQTWTNAEATILREIRLPRVVSAALVGAALSASGVLFQGVFRNPLVDPFIIGASSGAAFAAVIGFLIAPQAGFIIYGFSWVPALAFVGSLVTVLLVYFLARADGRVAVTTLLLAGVAVGAFLTAAMSFLMLTQSDSQFRLGAIFSWLLGGVGTVGWDQFLLLGPFVGIGLLVARALAQPLNAMSLGEEHAHALGVSVERTKLVLIAASSLMTAAAVAAAGLVAFVGLVTPHAVRLVIGPDHRRLLWAATLYGAIFVVLADLAARTILTPTEIPLGVITGIVGGPFFLLLLRRARGHYVF